MFKYFFLFLFFIFDFANAENTEKISINIYVSQNLSDVVKSATEDFQKSNNVDFNFIASSNSILFAKIQKNADFDLLFCDDQNISKMAMQQGLVNQNYAFLSDSLWVIASKNLVKIPQNLNDLQDLHIRRILVSQSANEQIFKYVKNIFQQTENFKLWNVLQNQQKKVFYTNSASQNLELLANQQAEISFALLSDALRFGKEKIQLAFEIDLGEKIINYFSAVNAKKDYQSDKKNQQKYQAMQDFLDYLRNPENKNYQNFTEIYNKFGYQAPKQENLKVQ